MGGRGKTSGAGFKQMNIYQLEERNSILQIINNSEEIRRGSENASVTRLYKKCACCEEYIIPLEQVNYTCEICGWVDDFYQNSHPDSLDGENSINLNDAKQKYSQNKNEYVRR